MQYIVAALSIALLGAVLTAWYLWRAVAELEAARNKLVIQLREAMVDVRGCQAALQKIRPLFNLADRYVGRRIEREAIPGEPGQE